MKIHELKDRHPLIYERVLECQIERGNKPNDELNLSDDAARGNFVWCLTKEGEAAWGDIDEFGYFGTFYKLMPEKDRPRYWDDKISEPP